MYEIEFSGSWFKIWNYNNIFSSALDVCIYICKLEDLYLVRLLYLSYWNSNKKFGLGPT